MRKLSLVAIASMALLAGGAATAGTSTFEDVATGVYSSVVSGGVTYTFTAGTGMFNVDSQSPGAPISAHNLISFFQNAGSGAFKATMAGGFSSFSIGMGDFNADDDIGHLEAYDASNNLLASDMIVVAPSVFGGGTMTVSSATPIAYVLFYETGSFAGAVYWDNAEFKPAVPEPQTYALMALGLAGLAAVARRRKAK